MNNKTDSEFLPIPIEVSAKILRHISRGIYRTPAGALKELISNAYDAGAQKVTINTGYPVFNTIIVTDDGKGMCRSAFEIIIRNIGLSDKVAGEKFNIPEIEINRTTIGHYGIGMLAIGQLCSRVKITSKIANSLKGFEATIDFEQFENVKRKNEIIRSKITEEATIEKEEKKILEKNKKNAKLPIGKCWIKNYRYAKKDKDTHFTKLELEVIRDQVQKKLSGEKLKEYIGLTKQTKYSKNFKSLLKLFRDNENAIRRGQYPYEKLCWELAVYSPLKYPDTGEFKEKSKLNKFKKVADKNSFEVIIDGISLYKPFEEEFFNDSNYPLRNIFMWDNEKYYKNKKVSGYLIYRQHIRPKCMQGVLIREEGVAIGNYDLTFLEYPYHEAVKFEQLTGELFVEGLSGSLNIDRNSFNETDDIYLKLVMWFHAKLHDEVFPKIKKVMKASRIDGKDLFAQIMPAYLKKYNSKNKIKLFKGEKNDSLFRKDGSILYLNQSNPLAKINKASVDKLILASILVSKAYVTPTKMEEILKKINLIKKEK